MIQKQMANELHELGIIKRFHGLDIHQTRDYMKISCELYIDKIISHHGRENDKTADCPIPMRNDSAYQASVELAKAPETEKEQIELEEALGFSYCQAIEDLIFALIICRPDIAVPFIKLSQYASRPASEHYGGESGISLPQCYTQRRARILAQNTVRRPSSRRSPMYSNPG